VHVLSLLEHPRLTSRTPAPARCRSTLSVPAAVVVPAAASPALACPAVVRSRLFVFQGVLVVVCSCRCLFGCHPEGDLVLVLVVVRSCRCLFLPLFVLVVVRSCRCLFLPLPLFFLLVIPEGDLLLFLSLFSPLFVLSVILSPAKGPRYRKHHPFRSHLSTGALALSGRAAPIPSPRRHAPSLGRNKSLTIRTRTAIIRIQLKGREWPFSPPSPLD
jgi:hypothetical protein